MRDSEEQISGSGIHEKHNVVTGQLPTTSRLAQHEVPLRSQPLEPIAICGMAFRLPGGINDEEAFWDLLVNKKDARTRIPETRFNIDAFYSDGAKTGTVRTQHGYFLQDDLAGLDTAFFSVSRSELETMDPQQRLLLEVTYECLESAGEVGWRGRSIGCYVGSFGEDWLEECSRDAQDAKTKNVSGSGDFAISNRVSYEFDFRGPSMTIRTACSSSLIALHQACQSLRAGDCTSAIVAGTNIILTPTMSTCMSQQGVISVEGSCKTFDAKADGYARGEAVNCVYLKPLRVALQDGSPVRAIIRGSGVNFDGKTSNISQPSTSAQEALIRHVYRTAQLDFDETGFVECHGTGTPVGDPIETKAVASCFKRGVHIGSVKPNMGHSEGASGLTSLIKSVLALERKTIPPNIKFTEPNPIIDFETSGLRVPVEATAWPEKCSYRVSINSFGIGGANAHVVVERSFEKENAPFTDIGDSAAQLLLLSAHHPDSLKTMIAQYQTYLNLYPEKLADLTYTLAVKRLHLPYRAFSVARPTEAISEFSIQSLPCKRQRPLILVFTGQGATWAGMGQELLQRNSVFRNSVSRADEVLAKLPNPPAWTASDELTRPQKTSRLHLAEFAQPLLTVIQVALIDYLRAVGVQPAAVVGHSSGEIAAAYAAGGLSFRDAMAISYYRGCVCRQQTKSGSMAVIGLGWEQTIPYLAPNTVVACDNSPSCVTISGDQDSVDKTMASIKAERKDVLARRLHVDKAYHSPHMLEVGGSYYESLKRVIEPGHASVKFFSSVNRSIDPEGVRLGARYWQMNLESPVLFKDAVSAAVERIGGDSVLLEIGPHSALGGLVREILTTDGHVSATYVSSLLRGKNGEECLLGALGNLYSCGIRLDLEHLQCGRRVLTDLPKYPWNHNTSLWHESRLVTSWKHRQHPHHELLGTRVVESTDNDPSWRNLLSLQNVSWLRDHKIRDDIVMPSAAYIAMLTECLKQMHVSAESYSLRNVLIKRALLLYESRSTEMVTTLSAHKLTDQLESAWWNFTVSAFTGTKWVKHCVGQIRAHDGRETERHNISRLPREIASDDWYEIMRKAGLNYGPEFSLMTNISASPSQHCATATILNKLDTEGTKYLVHPSSIDQMLQTFTVAVAQGQSRKLDKLILPSGFDQIEIRQAPTQMTLRAEAHGKSGGDYVGDVEGTDLDGQVVISLKGVQLSPARDDVHEATYDPHAMAQMIWQPSIHFMRPNELIHRLGSRCDGMAKVNEMTALVIIEFANKLENIQVNLISGDLGKYLRWIVDQKSALEHNEYPFIDNGPALVGMSSTARRESIMSLKNIIFAQPQGPSTINPILALYENIDALLMGETDPMAIFFGSDLIAEMYNIMYNVDQTPYVRALAHDKPAMRILEVGAGTGGSTQHFLPSLVDKIQGNPFYSSYVFTDISAGFFASAKERFKSAPNMEYKLLDISRDPLQQGFEPASFDLIIATNVIHVTPKLSDSLRNVRTLLKKDGRFLLFELCPSTRWINFVFGALPGWWNGGNDNRVSQPYISPEVWNEELVRAGFDDIEATLYDDESEVARGSALMIVRPRDLDAEETANVAQTSRISLLVQDKASPIVKHVQRQLFEMGFEPTIFDMADKLAIASIDTDVISLLEIESSFFATMVDSQFGDVQRLIHSLGDTGHGVLWVTRPSSIEAQSPEYAQAIGFARVLRSELILDIATLQMEPQHLLHSDALISVLQYFQQRRTKSADQAIDIDFEFLYDQGQIMTNRYHPIMFKDSIPNLNQDKQTACLKVTEPGILSSLGWRGETNGDLKAEDVEVEMRAVGVNFKDVLIAMGIVGSDYDGLGIEGSGIVNRIGSGVSTVRPGDRVMILGFKTFAIYATTHQNLCMKIPDGLTFEDAATMPCVYATAIRGLCDSGELEKGQSVLIHSACGGVGIAAIQICQMIGAEIYATVGNEKKVEYLQREFKIPRDHIFRSRDDSFLRDILRATHGRGVDLVLNSLSGELLHASWKCVAPFGKMIEIGKRDMIGRGSLALDVFEANRTFAAVDLTPICSGRTKQARRLLQRTIDFYEAGGIRPIPVSSSFQASEIESCFRSMQKGEHIGKIVVNMPDDKDSLSVQCDVNQAQFRSNATYLLIGGLGGLGKPVSTWMVERGARSLVLMSPNAGTRPADHKFVAELESMGCSVRLMAGKVDDMTHVKNALSQVPADAPLKGIFQMSMLLRDRPFHQMTFEEWREAQDCKVKGTWNLHNATIDKELELDFFVLFSSISGHIGNRGQANYAAANTFLDAFVPYRRSLDLPCSAIDVGMMADVGAITTHSSTNIIQQLEAYGHHPLHENQLLDVLNISIADQHGTSTTQSQPINSSSTRTLPSLKTTHPVLGIRSPTPLTDPSNRVIWNRDARFSIYHQPNLYTSPTSPSSKSTKTSSAIPSLLSSIKTSPSLLTDPKTLSTLSREIAHKLFDLLLKPTEVLDNPDQDVTRISLTEVGLDSLIAIEVRNWWKGVFGVEISMLDLLASETVGELAGKAVEGLKGREV